MHREIAFAMVQGLHFWTYNDVCKLRGLPQM